MTTGGNGSAGPLAGRVCIVTGAGSGIGRDTALALAQAGASVVLGNRTVVSGEEVAHEIERAGGRALFVRTDVSVPADCAALVGAADREFGRLDGAFNNAGLTGGLSPFDETAPEEFSFVVDVNLKGTFYMMRHECALMRRHGAGSIVNMSSIFGLKAMANFAHYVAAKHGVVGLTRAAALDHVRAGIRVNAVCPGPIKTPSLDRQTGGDDHAYDAFVPMHRIGQPREVAQAVIWLLSDASSYVNGATLSVDGGMVAA